MVEAMVIAVLLMSALAVVTLDPPQRASDGVRPELAAQIDGLLAHFAASPEPTGRYPSMLDRMVAEALQGNASLLQSKMARALPPGAVLNAFLDNGEGRVRLLWNGEAPGESVSAGRLWTPTWEGLLALPAVGLVDGKNLTLEAYGVPLRRALGQALEPGVRAEVEFKLPGGQVVTRTAFAPLGARAGGGPVAEVSFLDGSGGQVFAVRPGAGNDTLYLGVRHAGGAAIPAGTPLELRLPPGFTQVELPAADNPGWASLTVEGNATYGWRVQASLASSLSSGLRQLRVNATAPAWGPLHGAQARLDNGTLGSLDGLYVGSAHQTQSSDLPPGRGPFLSLPGLAPSGGLATAGLVVAYPDDPRQDRELRVHKVTLRAQGGATLEQALGLQPLTLWLRTGDVLTWDDTAGSGLALARDEALEFRFQLQATAPTAAALPPPAVGLDLRNGFTPQGAGLADAGLYRVALAGRNASAQGYAEAAALQRAVANLSVGGAERNASLAYETTALGLVRGSASDLGRGRAESWLAVDTPRAPLGGQVELRWDARRLAEELGLLGAQAFKCYTDDAGAFQWVADRAACDAVPGLAWQYRKEEPRLEARVYHPSPQDPGLPLAANATLGGLSGSAAVAVPLASLLGTHALELRATLPLDGPSGTVKEQSVAWVRTFEVTRAGLLEARAPFYDVVLEVWLPDWG